jgi:hypothetical protein
MYFPLVLAALVIISAVFLLRQYWQRELADDGRANDGGAAHSDGPDLLIPRRDDAAERRDALKAA